MVNGGSRLSIFLVGREYEAIEDCRPQRNQLMKLCIKQIPVQEYIVFGIDHTPWPRPDAKTLKDRTYEHQGKTQNGVAIWQGHSTIAWLPDAHSSWALPLSNSKFKNLGRVGCTMRRRAIKHEINQG